MATVIALASPKGGVGKTTTAIELACGLYSRKRRVLIVESDKELLSVMKWSGRARTAGHRIPDVALAQGDDFLPKNFSKTIRNHDVVIIDCPGHFGPEQRSAMLLADAIIMPVGPFLIELDGLAPLLKSVALAESVRRRPLPIAALMTRTHARDVDAKRVRATLADFGVDTLDVQFGFRKQWPRAYEAGESCVADAPTSDSAREVRRLIREMSERGIFSEEVSSHAIA